jgi:hypothetical protein
VEIRAVQEPTRTAVMTSLATMAAA